MPYSLVETGAVIVGAQIVVALCWQAWRMLNPVEQIVLVKLSDEVDLLVPKTGINALLKQYPRRTLRLVNTVERFKLSSRYKQVNTLRQLPRITMFDEKESQPLCVVLARDGSTLTCIYNRSLHAWRVLGPVHEKFI